MNLLAICDKQHVDDLSTLGWAFAASPPCASVVYLSGKSGSDSGTKLQPDVKHWHQ